MIEKNKIKIKFNKKYSIALTLEEWSHLQSFIVSYYLDGRKKFKTEFDDFLSTKLQDQGVFCHLRCVYNWFKCDRSQKRRSSFWRGVYKCVQLDCKNVYLANINDQIPINFENLRIKDVLNVPSIRIDIDCEVLTVHEYKISKKIRCFGLKRKKEALQILAKGVLNVQSENIINNHHISENTGKFMNFN